MSDFCSQLREGYERIGCKVESGLLLAVSGGADSIALLHGTRRIFPEHTDRIAVAHVNHSLRGRDSDKDAEFVRCVAEQLRLKCSVETLQIGEIERNSEGSLEESARLARYDLLTQTAVNQCCQFVVTAHHKGDQAETILHNIIRGTGIRGLAGMKSRRPLDRNVSVARPMLTISHDSVREFLKVEGLQFREDASNSDARFTRNRIRHQLIPLLRQDYNPQVDDNLLSLRDLAVAAMASLDNIADMIIEASLLEIQPNVCRFRRAPFQSHPESLICHVLSKLWSDQQWPRQKMTSPHWKKVASAIHGVGNHRIDLPGGICVLIDGNIVRLVLRSP